MSDGQVPDYLGVPEPLVRRWINRPIAVSASIAGLQSGGYLLFAGLLDTALVVGAHRKVVVIPIWIAMGALLVIGSSISYRVGSRRAANLPNIEPELSIIELRDRILAQMSHDVVAAYPSRYAALRVFPALAFFSIGAIALSIWTNLIVWPFAVSAGLTAAIGLVVFLLGQRQGRRDLRWALDYQEPLRP